MAAETEWHAVQNSTNVVRVAWSAEERELLIEFKNGSVYAYPDAGEAAFQDLLTAASPGSYVNRWLKNQHYRRVS